MTLEAETYWATYYADEFVFGLGTEEVLAALRTLPAVRSWLDLGSGSESLFWAISLDFEHLTAVDSDPRRLAILRSYASTAEPRGAYRTALELCGRSHASWRQECASLRSTVIANCLGDDPLPFAEESADLVTQFGLLGLCADNAAFVATWGSMSRLIRPSGWCAGANWVAGDAPGRVMLSRSLYESVMAETDIRPHLLTRVATPDDRAYDAVWIYVGEKA